MPHEHQRPRSFSPSEDLAGEPISLALADIRERLRAAGPLAEGDDPTAAQWRHLRAGAGFRDRLFAHEPLEWLTAQGGSEHLCRYHRHVDRWEKITHANGAGWWIDPDGMLCLPATPLQYLERLALVNEVFGDDIGFVGVDVGPHEYTCRIRTTQRSIPGDAPSVSTLVQWLITNGFTHEKELKIGAYDAVCFRRGAVWLFDVRPMNFVETSEGQLFPIDIIVQDLSEG